jgi:hypothetical protein
MLDRLAFNWGVNINLEGYQLVLLDVHILSTMGQQLTEWPIFFFEESIHTKIFFGSTVSVGMYPQLERMRDYYGEAAYEGDDLNTLVRELTDVIPKFPSLPAVALSLKDFLAVSGHRVTCLFHGGGSPTSSRE